MEVKTTVVDAIFALTNMFFLLVHPLVTSGDRSSVSDQPIVTRKLVFHVRMIHGLAWSTGAAAKMLRSHSDSLKSLKALHHPALLSEHAWMSGLSLSPLVWLCIVLPFGCHLTCFC